MALRIRATLRRDSGASAVEYGLLVAAIAAVIAATVFLFGGAVQASFQNSCDVLNGAPGGPSTCA